MTPLTEEGRTNRKENAGERKELIGNATAVKMVKNENEENEELQFVFNDAIEFYFCTL